MRVRAPSSSLLIVQVAATASMAALRAAGAAAVEGVPRDDTTGRRWPDPVAYTGTASTFRRAGFTGVDRRRDDRVVYRLVL